MELENIKISISWFLSIDSTFNISKNSPNECSLNKNTCTELTGFSVFSRIVEHGPAHPLRQLKSKAFALNNRLRGANQYAYVSRALHFFVLLAPSSRAMACAMRIETPRCANRMVADDVFSRTAPSKECSNKCAIKNEQ